MQKTSLVFIAMLIAALSPSWCSCAHAEAPPAREWLRSWNGPTNHSDDPVAALTLADRSVIIAGKSHDATAGGARPMILRYGAAGDILWSAVEPTFDRFESLHHSSTGDVLLMGMAFIKSSWHVFVRRLDPNDGSTVWQASRPATLGFAPFIAAVAEDPATQTVLVAAARSNDFLVARFSMIDGSFITEHLFDGPEHTGDRATSILPRPEGGFVVSGPIGNSSGGYLTIAADAAGEILWTDHEEGPIGNTFTPTWLGLDAQGNVLVGGGPETPCGLFQFRAWKISPTGERLWTVEWPTANCASAEPEDFAITADGSIVMAGQTHNPFNIAVLHVDPSGQSWTRVWNGPAGGVDGGTAVDCDAGGNVIVGGFAGVAGGRDCAVIGWSSAGVELFSRVEPSLSSNTDSVIDLSVGPHGSFSIVSGGFTSGQNNNIFTLLYQRAVRPGDVNLNGVVNVEDLLGVIAGWGPCPAFHASCPGDVAPASAGNGIVNVEDLLAVIGDWG